jgi:hypothetical protein
MHIWQRVILDSEIRTRIFLFDQISILFCNFVFSDVLNRLIFSKFSCFPEISIESGFYCIFKLTDYGFERCVSKVFLKKLKQRISNFRGCWQSDRRRTNSYRSGIPLVSRQQFTNRRKSPELFHVWSVPNCRSISFCWRIWFNFGGIPAFGLLTFILGLILFLMWVLNWRCFWITQFHLFTEISSFLGYEFGRLSSTKSVVLSRSCWIFLIFGVEIKFKI